ncbi:MAG: threonine--tRNA ligase [bacterium]|nr:threonine--tRNA ligase [bacterium]
MQEKDLIELQLEKIRHSSEHILTYVMLQDLGLDKITMAMGPAIESGFYFDFAHSPDVEISATSFPKWEKTMKKIIQANWTMKEFTVDIPEAARFFARNSFKQEILADLDVETVTLFSLAPQEKNDKLTDLKSLDFESAFKAGYFVDLCKGPHVEKTGEIKAFKLLRIAAAYWRGDEKNQQLTRIYGTAFASQEELDQYLAWLEESKKRDHKRIGKIQDLFSFHSISPGAVFWHPKGLVIWDTLERFGQGLRKKYGYLKIKTPEMAKVEMWKISGHWDHYKDDMFSFQADDEQYCLKPMDCPFNIKIYQTQQRSYRDLPMRFTEIGHVFRNEQSGELNGLFRVREITQDDSHLLVREDQILPEIEGLLEMVKEYYQKLGLQPEYFLSTRPDDFMGEINTWNRAEANLIEALTKQGISYALKEKDGAFYGPKIDVNIKDSLGRSWQVATIQLDFQMPGRFGCEYIDAEGKKQVPVMIHAAIFGSYERMIGILLEHYAGRLPLWLAPVQVKILPIADRHLDYAREVQTVLEQANFRSEIDERSERLNAKIRLAQEQQIPAMLVIGDGEVTDRTITLRWRDQEQQEKISLTDLVVKMSQA